MSTMIKDQFIKIGVSDADVKQLVINSNTDDAGKKLKKIYREMCKKYHPDSTGNEDSATVFNELCIIFKGLERYVMSQLNENTGAGNQQYQKISYASTSQTVVRREEVSGRVSIAELVNIFSIGHGKTAEGKFLDRDLLKMGISKLLVTALLEITIRENKTNTLIYNCTVDLIAVKNADDKYAEHISINSGDEPLYELDQDLIDKHEYELEVKVIDFNNNSNDDNNSIIRKVITHRAMLVAFNFKYLASLSVTINL